MWILPVTPYKTGTNRGLKTYQVKKITRRIE